MPSEVLVLERESAVAQDDYAWLIFLSEAAVEESAVDSAEHRATLFTRARS